MPAGKFWTIEEDNFLKMFYNRPSSSIKDIAAYLNRTEQAVTSRAAYLRLKKVPYYMTNNLTPREQEVFALLLTDLSYKEIANQLDVKVSTVVTHAQMIFEKKYVHNRKELKEKHYEIKINS